MLANKLSLYFSQKRTVGTKIYVFITIAVSIPLCLYLCVYTSLSIPLCLYLCVYTSVCIPLCSYLCVYTSVSIPLCLYLCVYTSVFIPLCLYLCVYTSVSIPLFLYTVSIPLCLYLRVYTSVSIPLCLYLWRSINSLSVNHRPVVTVSTLRWLIRYIYYWNLHFLNNVVINKTNDFSSIRNRWPLPKKLYCLGMLVLVSKDFWIIWLSKRLIMSVLDQKRVRYI
jgi:hypothetical protein